jgi:ribonuclease HII
LKELDYRLEAKYASQGFTHIIGADGAGLGAVFGPIYAACTAYQIVDRVPEVYDSKAISHAKRVRLYDQIRKTSIVCAVASASVKMFDEKGPLECEIYAMLQAIKTATAMWPFPKSSKVLVLIDGSYGTNVCWRMAIPGIALVQSIPQGDSRVLAIAAASILAKVDRDAYIVELAKQYPKYNLESHKGYCTKTHIESIREHGLSVHHRRSAYKFNTGPLRSVERY